MDIDRSKYKTDADEIISDDMSFLWHHILQHKLYESSEPIVICEGKGLIIKDIRGNEFLDATSGGVWCVNVGYGRDSIADAVSAQLKKMPYFMGKFGNIPTIQYAKKLISLLPLLNKVYFSNSGSEAVEKAFKIIRQSVYLNQNKKSKILYRNRDYHGTTFGALSATGQPERLEGFGPFLDGFVEFPHALCYRCFFGKTYPDCNVECARAVEQVIQKEDPDTVGGIIMETITAGGGVIPPVKEYYPIIQEICKKHQVSIILDEVVCGFGRTGKMFGLNHYDISPDMVILAKGMASSYMPISATVVKQEIFDTFLNDPTDKMGFFRDISTYGGCAGGATAGIENIHIIEEENLIQNAKVMGNYLIEQLAEMADLPIIGDIRGKGLFVGIELVEDKITRKPVDESVLNQIIGAVRKEGVMVGGTSRSFRDYNNTIYLAPALVVSKNEIDIMVKALKKSLENNPLK